LEFELKTIEALAPDQASLSAASKLTKRSNWPRLEKSEQQALIWGECQGSGSNPYRTVVDTGDHGYKCTCPSRKFPCKHTLALMWIFVVSRYVHASIHLTSNRLQRITSQTSNPQIQFVATGAVTGKVLQGVFITLVAPVLGELESTTEEPLVAGVARASMDRQNSLAVEWRGWLGLGKRQGWSEGRRGGEWRNDGVNVGS